MLQLSVITVCFNAENEIRKTIESVISQEYIDYEYIIVDGKSSDYTVCVAEQYSEQFKQKGVSYIIYSEKDTGIYNAMNKGIEYANGKWIIFLNAGDYFATNSVLAKFNPYFLKEDIGVVYGDTILERNQLFRYDKSREIDCIRQNMPFCHQSVFTLTRLLKKIKFDERYKICADYNFFLDCYELNEKFTYAQIVVSVFNMSGISSDVNLELQNEKELLDILYSHKLKSRKQCEYYKLRARVFRYISEYKKKIVSIIPIFIKKRFDLYKSCEWKSNIEDIIQ